MAEIVEAVGTATNSKKGGGRRVEKAMADAIKDIERESDAIWKDQSLSLEERNKRIAAINAPEAMRARMMEARETERAKIREEAAAREEAAKATKH